MKTLSDFSISKKVLMVLPFYLFTFLPLLNAQTFTQRIQNNAQGQGTVTIHQNAEIENLVNGTTTTTPKKEVKPQAKKPTPTPKADDKQQKADDKQLLKTDIKQLKTDTKQATVAITQKETVADSVEQAPRHTYKTTGYRIQVFAGGNTRRDRQRAEQAGNALKGLFPGEEIYVHFYSPRWICRMGNYRTYEDAHEKMLEVRKMGYDAATIVKGKITLPQK